MIRHNIGHPIGGAAMQFVGFADWDLTNFEFAFIKILQPHFLEAQCSDQHMVSQILNPKTYFKVHFYQFGF